MEKKLVEALKAMLGIYAKVTLVAPKSIARSEGKAVRIIDKRKI
jgi:phenylacetate-CoA ligase